jgi:hypothetical protein
MKYLFDEHFSKSLIELMRKCDAPGELIHVIPSGFSGLPDDKLISTATESGFIIVTGDRNERTRNLSVEDLKALGARVILIGGFWNHLKNWDAAKWLIARWDRMYEQSREWPAGTCGLAAKNGDIEIL